MGKVTATRAPGKLLAASLPLAAALAGGCAGEFGASSASARELVVMVEEEQLSSWALLEELAREMEEAHPGLRVRLFPLGGAAGAQDRAKFLIAGGLQLDLMRIDITELAAYATEGALLDLTPYFATDPSWDAGAYYPQVLEALRTTDGRLCGLPSTFTPYVMYVNRDLLERAGLAVPTPDWTWDDLVALARQVTADTDGDGRSDQYGISLTQWMQAVAPWVWQSGGGLLDEGGRSSRMGERPFREAMHFLHSLLHDEQLASFDASLQNQLGRGLFQAGRAAFYGPVGYWETFRFQHIEEFVWDVVPLPRNARRATSLAMTAYVVPRTAREPELAYELMRKLAGPRYQERLAEIGNGVPGLIEAAQSASFLKPALAPESEQVFLDSMEFARFMPPLANWRKIESITNAELQGILLDPDEDVDAACLRMAAKTDAFLERERTRSARSRMPVGIVELALSLSLLGLAAVALGARARAPARAELRNPTGHRAHAYGMIALWGAGFLLFFLGPAVVSFVLSLAEWSPLRPLADARWLGLDNFARLGGDDTFRTSIVATLLYAALSVPFSLALALALALLLQRESTSSSLVRTVCYLPAVLAPVIVATLWRQLLDPDDGLLNRILAGLGIDGPAWLRDADWAVPSFVLMSLWGVGAQMLVFLAALKALDRTLFDAARIDGAGRWQRFRHVTLPALTPVVLFNLVTGTIQALQIFAQPYVMTEGGPGDASRFLVLYLYESGFRHLDMGYASVLAWVLFALSAAASLVLLRTSHRWVHYSGEKT